MEEVEAGAGAESVQPGEEPWLRAACVPTLFLSNFLFPLCQ